MSVPNTRYLDVCRQRDRLARALKRITRHHITDGFGSHYIPHADIDNARRALELTFPQPDITPAGRAILAAFKRNRHGPQSKNRQ